MAKIISGPDAWTYRFTHTCGATVEVDTGDLKGVNTAKAWGGETWDPHVFVACPYCGDDVMITPHVPAHIQKRLYSNLKPLSW